MIAMPVRIGYCINFLSALFPDVSQVLASHFPHKQAQLALFSFAFNGQYNNAPAGNTVAGELLFFKRIA
jgi:hypothetical protein